MIQEIYNKLDYAQLLSESDPNINLVEDYLERGRLFAYFKDNQPVSFIVCLPPVNHVLEIKNIYTLDQYRGHGYAKTLIQHIENLYQDVYTIKTITANSSMQNIAFYTKLGYRYDSRIENFFIDYYPQEIYENGMQSIDLLYFVKSSIQMN